MEWNVWTYHYLIGTITIYVSDCYKQWLCIKWSNTSIFITEYGIQVITLIEDYISHNDSEGDNVDSGAIFA